MTPNVLWFFGRGLSIGCNLKWDVPQEWADLRREDCIERIKVELRAEMGAAHVDCTDIARFLHHLSEHTVDPWRHLFITTNWDYLLQREIDGLELDVQPEWLVDSQVFHLNGTVEILQDNSQRSPFLLTTDPPAARKSSLEANKAFGHMGWNRLFVVVGMSFECQMDRFLLTSLSGIQDDLPIGMSTWIIVNPDPAGLLQSAGKIQGALPGATVLGVAMTFRKWMDCGFPELQQAGVVAAPA